MATIGYGVVVTDDEINALGPTLLDYLSKLPAPELAKLSSDTRQVIARGFNNNWDSVWLLLEDVASARGVALMQLCEDDNEDGAGATAVVCRETMIERRLGYSRLVSLPETPGDTDRPARFLALFGYDSAKLSATCWIVGVTNI